MLRDNLEILQGLFSRLGFRLESHPRGFYYFHGMGSLSDRSERMAVFMFILVEWLSDRGKVVEESLMTRKFSLSALPYLQVERYRKYMEEAGVSGMTGLMDIVRNLERFGFAKRAGQTPFPSIPLCSGSSISATRYSKWMKTASAGMREPM